MIAQVDSSHFGNSIFGISMKNVSVTYTVNRQIPGQRYCHFFAMLAITFLLLGLTNKLAFAVAFSRQAFAEQRKAIAASPAYNPYDLQIKEVEGVEEAKKLWNKKRFDDAYKRLFSLLDAFPASILAVQSLKIISDSQARHDNNPIKKKKAVLLSAESFTKEVFLRDAILASGDGKSPTTAYWVLTINEEYYLLRYLGYKCKQQSLILLGDKKFDELKTIGEKGDARTFYFNVTHFSKNSAGGAKQTSPADLSPPPQKQKTEIFNVHPFRPRETQHAKVRTDNNQP
ncbi:MAG: DUF4919 domain-containing protein [Pseudomonadota bacterium]